MQVNTGIPNILSCKAALQATSLVYQDNNQQFVVLMPIREYIQRILPPAESRVQSICQHFYALMVLYDKYIYREDQLKPLNILQQGLHLNSPTFADTLQCTLALNRFYTITGRDHSPLLDDIQPLLPQLCDQQLETMVLIVFLASRDYWTAVSEDMITRAIIHLDRTNNPHLGSTQFYHKALEMAKLCGDSTQECITLLHGAGFKYKTADYCAANASAAECKAGATTLPHIADCCFGVMVKVVGSS
ncbi:hypothetical protein K438DRAFT_2138096 [Mycena galopus ATCC 62051]|nr:hypothetical protein K438DRAFT_2138096 [Mycena galopus ATCC 62051]